MKLLLAAVLALAAGRANAGCSNASAANVLLGSGCEVIISTSGTQTNIPGANGLSVTYGLAASTAVITYVQASSITTTGTMTAHDGINVSADAAALKFGLADATATIERDGSYAGLYMGGNLRSAGAQALFGAGQGAAAVSVYAVGTGLLRNSVTGALQLEANSVTGIKIDTAGEVGIGTTNDPATKLHMSSGTLTIDGAGAGLTTTGDATFGGANGIILPRKRLNLDTAAGPWGLGYSTVDGGENIRYDSYDGHIFAHSNAAGGYVKMKSSATIAGSLGIGTSAPGAPLEVKSSQAEQNGSYVVKVSSQNGSVMAAVDGSGALTLGFNGGTPLYGRPLVLNGSSSLDLSLYMGHAFGTVWEQYLMATSGHLAWSKDGRSTAVMKLSSDNGALSLTNGITASSMTTPGNIALNGSAERGIVGVSGAATEGFFFDSSVNNDKPFIRANQTISIKTYDGSAYVDRLAVETGASGAVKIHGSTLTALGTGQVGISTPVAGMNGNLRVRAGNGNGGGTVPITLFSWIGSSTTQGGGPGTIVGHSETIPANTLVNNGDMLEVFCLAKATTTSLSKILSVTVDGDQDGTGTSTNVARQWTNKSIITRTTSTNLMHHAERERGDPSGSQGQSVDIDYTNTVTLTNSFVVSCDIRADNNNTAAGDEVMDLKQMVIKYIPAP